MFMQERVLYCNSPKIRYNKKKKIFIGCNKNRISCIIMVKGVNKQMANMKLVNDSLIDQWITGIAVGDRNALEQLYHATSAAVYAYSLSILKNVHDAEDVLQDCFISIHASAQHYRPTGKPMAWIITIARNLCLMRLREQKKNVELPLDDWKDYLETNEEMTTMDRILVSECLSRLPEQDRQIVVLHAVGGFKHREIAQFLDMPLPTVLSKYHRALQKLRKHF